MSTPGVVPVMAVTRKGSDVYSHVTVFLQSIFVAPFLELCSCRPVSLKEGERLSRTLVSRSDTLCKSTKTSSLGSAYKPALAGSKSAADSDESPRNRPLVSSEDSV